MDLALKAELLFAGGYADTLTPAVRRRILAWERTCTRRGYHGYVTKPVGDRAKEAAFGIYGGAMLRDTEEGAMLLVRW